MRRIAFLLAVAALVAVVTEVPGALVPTANAAPDRPPRELVSVDEEGNPALGSYDAAITPDGRYVTFTSTAPNLPRGEITSGCPIVYVRDLVTDSLEIASRADDGTVLCGRGMGPGDGAISNDGRFVLFVQSDNESPIYFSGPTYVRDVQEDRTQVATVDVDGSVLDIGAAQISGDGRWVAYQSGSIYLRNLSNRRSRALTPEANGDDIDRLCCVDLNSLSDNGRYLAASVILWNPVPEEWYWYLEACGADCPVVYDRVEGSFSVSGRQSGTEATAGPAWISPRGRFLASDFMLGVYWRGTQELITQPRWLNCCDGSMAMWSGDERFLLTWNFGSVVVRYKWKVDRYLPVAGSFSEACFPNGLTMDGAFAVVTCGTGPGGTPLVYLVGPIGQV